MSIEWWNKVILVPKSYMTQTQSTPIEIRELDMDAFRLDLRALEADPEGILWLHTHDHVAPIPVGGVTLARVVEIVNGYTITFEDGQYTVNIVGGNSNIGDNINANQVSVRSFNSAGLITSDGIEAIEYENAVTIDVVNGVAGTIYPIGTLRRPVDNLSDAQLIATVRGFDNLFILGNITFGATDDISGYTIRMANILDGTITVASGCVTTNTIFINCNLTGTLLGACLIYDSFIQTLSGFQGTMKKCSLLGTLTLAGSGAPHIVQCYDGFEGLGEPIIDFDGSGRGLNMRDYQGGVRLQNKNGTEDVSIGLNAARLEIDSSVTAGEIVVHGIGYISENLGSATIKREGLVDSRLIRGMIGENTVVEYTYTGDDNTGAIFYFYDSETNATLHDKATGLLNTLTMTGTFVSSKPTVMKVVE